MYDVVMLVLNDVAYDRRVRAEAAALAAAGWRVLVIGTQRHDGLLPDQERMQGFDLRRARYGRFGAALWRPWRWVRHVLQAWQLVRTLRGVRTRAYHAHDLPALILLSIVRTLDQNRAALVYDAHELYFFMTRDDPRLVQIWRWLTLPLFVRLEGRLARRADAILGLAEERGRFMARWYGVPRPTIIHNALDPVAELCGLPVDLRRVVGTDRRIIVHTGDLTERGRCLGELVESVARLPDDAVLVFLGQGTAAAALRADAARSGIAHRVYFVPPVPPEQVATTIRAADAAVILLRPDSYNIRAAIPNKLWEAVAAGVPVVASNTRGMVSIIRRYHLGIVYEGCDPATVAGALSEMLSPDTQMYYRARVKEAQQVLNWQTEAAKLCALYREVLR